MFRKIIRVVCLITGIMFLLLPIYQDYQLYLSQQQSIKEFQKQLDFNTEEKKNTSEVDLTAQKAIAVIHIPKINVTLPVYRGTSEKAISNGVGLLEGTSEISSELGEHSVLTSHSGLSLNQLFTRLGELENSDEWFIKDNKGKVYGYRVNKIQKVLPTEVDAIKKIKDKNLMTLVTCTPIFVNTHRLLVTGEYFDTSQLTIESSYNILANNRTYIIIVLSVILVIFILWCVFRKVGKWREKKQ